MITSYAQNFEDVMLWRALSHVEHGFYIDIGAQDPVVDSVSLAFYERGWRGVHVEPTARYADALRAHRPNDTVVQAAVAERPGVLNFFEIAGTGISTADPVIAAGHKARGFDLLETVVPSISLSDIFAANPEREVHWLKIDVEGLEWAVLRGWGDSPARPWIVVVESTLPLTQTPSYQEWEPLLLERGYEVVYFDGLNRFYLSRAHPELRDAFAAPPNVFDGFRLNGTASAPFHALLADRLRQTVEQMQTALEAREAELRDEAQASLRELKEQFNAARRREAAALASLVGVVVQLRQVHAYEAPQDGALPRSNRLIGLTYEPEREAYREKDELMAAHLDALRQECTQLIEQAAARELHLANALCGAEAAAAKESAAVREGLEQLVRQQRQHAQELSVQAAQADRRLAEQAAEAAHQLAKEAARSEAQAVSHMRELYRARADLRAVQAALRHAQRQHADEIRRIQARLSLARRHKHAIEQAALIRERQLETELAAARERHASELQVKALESTKREHRLISELELARHEFETRAKEWNESRQQTSQHLSILHSLLETERREFTQRDAQAFERIADLERKYADVVARAGQLTKAINDIRMSFGWKIMAPFRAVFEKKLYVAVEGMYAYRREGSRVTLPRGDKGHASPDTFLSDSAAETQSSTPTEQNMSDGLTKALADSGETPHASTHRLRDFMTGDDSKFVVQAYRALLRRDPDPDGFRHFLDRARRGDSRVRILAAILQSEEGKINNVRVSGLKLAASKLKFASIPVIGPVFAKLWGYDEQRELAVRRFTSIDDRLESISVAQASLLAAHERKTSDIQASIAALAARFDALSAHITTSAAASATVHSAAAAPVTTAALKERPGALAAGVPADVSPKSVLDAPVILTQPDAQDVISTLSTLLGSSREAQMLAAR